MKENKLFTQEAVSTALKICVLGSLGLANPKKLAEKLASLPDDLGKMVMASIMAGHTTLLISRASEAEQETLNGTKESQKNENSKTT